MLSGGSFVGVYNPGTYVYVCVTTTRLIASVDSKNITTFIVVISLYIFQIYLLYIYIIVRTRAYADPFQKDTIDIILPVFKRMVWYYTHTHTHIYIYIYILYYIIYDMVWCMVLYGVWYNNNSFI